MATPTFLYHQSEPQGRVFDLDVHSLPALIEQGWVDDPCKLGYDAWDGDHEKYAGLRDKVKKGEVPAVGKYESTPDPTAEHKRLQQANADLHKRLREQETVEQALRQRVEELNDKKADVERKRVNQEDKPARKRQASKRKPRKAKPAPAPEPAEVEVELEPVEAPAEQAAEAPEPEVPAPAPAPAEDDTEL